MESHLEHDEDDFKMINKDSGEQQHLRDKDIDDDFGEI